MREKGLAQRLDGRREAVPAETHKHRQGLALETPTALEQTAKQLASDIAVALSSQIEELNTYSHAFRSSLMRVFLRVLRLGSKQDQQVVLFNEAVPGYTLMLFKKQVDTDLLALAPQRARRGSKAKSKQDALLAASAPGRAAEALIGEYFHRTGKRVLVVEHPDALFVFFPATDLRKNVRELGFFID